MSQSAALALASLCCVQAPLIGRMKDHARPPTSPRSHLTTGGRPFTIML